MKNYTLEATIKGQTIKFDKKFKSRNSAINHIFNYYNKHYLYNLQVNEEFARDNRHSVEYVLNSNDRFVINRESI